MSFYQQTVHVKMSSKRIASIEFDKIGAGCGKVPTISQMTNMGIKVTRHYSDISKKMFET